jgi:hypothetical protein
VKQHYVNDSASAEWLRECVKDETEEATVVLPAITFRPMPEIDMSDEEALVALEAEFGERRAA